MCCTITPLQGTEPFPRRKEGRKERKKERRKERKKERKKERRILILKVILVDVIMKWPVSMVTKR